MRIATQYEAIRPKQEDMASFPCFKPIDNFQTGTREEQNQLLASLQKEIEGKVREEDAKHVMHTEDHKKDRAKKYL